MENIEIRNIPVFENIIFTGKQNIPWKCVEKYLKSYVGLVVKVEEYQDKIVIAGNFPDEYTGSKYTKSLRGAVAKAKANAVQVIEPMIQYATNRRWTENKSKKHKKDASEGWYRYDTKFYIQVQSSNEFNRRLNLYSASIIVRMTLDGLFLYDVINIKKEASKPLESP